MDIHSLVTLLLIETNNVSAETLVLGRKYSSRWAAMRVNGENYFDSRSEADFSNLGQHVSRNTSLRMLIIRNQRLHPESALNVMNDDLFNGLSSNSSLQALSFQGPIDGMWARTMEAFRNKRLQYLHMRDCDLSILDNGLLNFATILYRDTLISCSNHLCEVRLCNCAFTNWQLSQVVGAFRCLSKLEMLDLHSCTIGNAGCNIVAMLLEDPNCNLQTLYLSRNNIDKNGVDVIANSLTRNNKLGQLYLDKNEDIHPIQAYDTFEKLICNTTSVDTLYTSNHTLSNLFMGRVPGCEPSISYLTLNEKFPTKHVATIKILLFFSLVDMKPIVELDSNGEQTLKGLPHLVDWFERAETVIDYDDNDGTTWHHLGETWHNIKAKRLSTVFQFAQLMPFMFVPVSHINKSDKKRKRE